MEEISLFNIFVSSSVGYEHNFQSVQYVLFIVCMSASMLPNVVIRMYASYVRLTHDRWLMLNINL